MTLIDAAKAVVRRWDSIDWKDIKHTAEYINDLRKAIENAPPQRQWVGLTDDEIALMDLNCGENKQAYARAIEAKLRGKNT